MCTLFSHSLFAKLSIEGVDGALKENVASYLGQINYPASDGISELAIEKYIGEAQTQMRQALSAYGYFSPSFSYSVKGKPATLQDWKDANTTVTINKGPVSKVSLFVFDSDLKQSDSTPADLTMAIDNAKLALSNKPFVSSEYEKHKSSIQSKATAYGYFNFKWIKHQANVTAKNADVQIQWQISFGPRYQFGALRYLRDERGSDLVESVKPFQQGDWFVQQKLGTFSQRIRQTGYFDSVIVRPNVDGSAGSEEQPGSAQKQVLIELILETKPKDSFQFGAGVSTDTGPRITASWKRPWINLRGHSVSSALYLSRPKQTLDLNYTVPMANPLNDFFKFQLGLENIQQNQTDSSTFTLAAQRQLGAKQEQDWNKVGFVRYESERFTQGFQEQQSSQLLLPGISLNRTRKQGDIFVDWGDRQFFSLEGASKSVISDIDLARLLISSKWIRTFDKHRFIFRADIGALVSNDYDAVPSSLRFFAGGDQSIRGFGLNEVAQEVFSESNQRIELIGGRYLNVGSIEYAYSVADNWRVATFVDAGGAGQKFADEIAYGIGAGVHWLSPIGTVRLYIARGVSDTQRTWRLHFNIGPGL